MMRPRLRLNPDAINFGAIVAFVVLAVGAAPPRARAQATTVTIAGTATDELRAVLPGVSVHVQNTETGVTRALVTNELGGYRALELPPGIYAVTAELSGFTTARRENLVVEI